ncbi:MAG: MFS transporter [Acidocella sp.]|nr:MFS transporter [Acidocella sp.]
MPNARVTAMRLCFGMAGVGISVWAVTVPYTKVRFGLTDGALGLMLLAGGMGGVVVMPAAGMAVARYGSRAVLRAVGLGFGLLLPGLSIVPSPAMFTLLLFLFGALFGALDVALNAQGAVIERQSGRLLMSGFHACYSLGTLGVALVSFVTLAAGESHFGGALIDAAMILLILTQARFLVPRTAEGLPVVPDRLAPWRWHNGARVWAVMRGPVPVLGFCCFACFMTEGVATDWSTIFLRFSRGMPLASAALGYAAFAVATTATRLAGDRVAARVGQAAVLRAGCVMAVAGFALVVFVPFAVAGVIGFGLVGLGSGNIAPLIFSAAARAGAVAAVMGVGYAGFLIGPVVIGLVADRLGLGSALALDGVLIGAVFFAGRAVAI